MERMWINQPSTLQPLHKLDGVLVLAQDDGRATLRAYPTSGDVISLEVPRLALSKGWPQHLRCAYVHGSAAHCDPHDQTDT